MKFTAAIYLVCAGMNLVNGMYAMLGPRPFLAVPEYMLGAVFLAIGFWGLREAK